MVLYTAMPFSMVFVKCLHKMPVPSLCLLSFQHSSVKYIVYKNIKISVFYFHLIIFLKKLQMFFCICTVGADCINSV
uniref:Uncharacterized protein n=1 Tax=Anguilla anguilla TaxID=7936 RepID=A0A0E9RP58_ANGAN